MFKSLKEKLKGVSKKFGSSIDESIANESATGDLQKEIPSAVLEVTETQQKAETKTNSFSENQILHDADELSVSPAEVSPTEPKKASFAKKLKVLVTEREILLSEKDIQEPLDELEMILLENDVAFDAVDTIISHMKKSIVGQKRKLRTSSEDFVKIALKEALMEVLGEGFSLTEYINLHEKPVKILFTGVNGAGKTTTIAKVAHYLKNNGYSVVIGSGDTFRAGANEQMKTHAERVGVKVINHQEGADPSAVLFDAVSYAKAHNIDVVLADTAGRFHNRANLMNQLEKIRRVMKPDIVAYVDEAVAGNDAVIRAEEFNNAVGTDTVVLTKADMDTKGGAAISITHTIKKPIMFLGVGQGYDDVIPFEPEKIVNELLGADI
ncbi:signal recognition particle-docking protein FtsY [Methanomicrobium antiquum]|uniref:Signal recognition particle receptor FtsY n=1 Tax=Methanomicrobium antiquum TaxID=487686 RepID=A0AAF0FS94_9EURY|nr:signal recognition particle-docking protein FtsY [Methanomicrobium antiquum]MDD3976898.1 signal recognition particle-docking protein FtsY [Methanomicrobium sp.]WFN37559.1 signal recognition particle-docking protein FtsY [Methanomicrobium antiquum]